MKTISAKIINGEITFLNEKEKELVLSQFEGKNVTIEVKKKIKRRTNTQNKSIHLYFGLLAEALNDAGYDIRRTLKKDFDIPWTSETIKNFLWRPVQLVYTGKKSSKNIKTKDIDKIYDIVNKNLGEKTGVYVPFPCIENLILEQGEY